MMHAARFLYLFEVVFCKTDEGFRRVVVLTRSSGLVTAGSFRLTGKCSFVGGCLFAFSFSVGNASLVCLHAVRMCLLWSSIICLVLFVQL